MYLYLMMDECYFYSHQPLHMIAVVVSSPGSDLMFAKKIGLILMFENLNNHIEAGEKMIIADLMTWQEDVKGLQGVVKPHIIF